MRGADDRFCQYSTNAASVLFRADYRSYRLANFSTNAEITFGDEVADEKP
jgi:hypothetical protein